MVISQNVQCSICSKLYFVRIGVGTEGFQTHYFDCLECDQPIGVAVRAQPGQANIETVENCKLLGFDDTQTIINLHPNFCFPIKNFHDRKFFPSLYGIQKISKHMRMIEGAFHQDIAYQFDMPNAKDLWSKVTSIYKLSEDKSKFKVYSKLINGYNIQRSKNNQIFTRCDDYLDVFEDFLDGNFYPKINNLTNPIKAIIDSLHANNKLDDFYAFYDSELKKENILRYLSTFSSFFKNKDTLGQMLYSARIEDDDIDNLMVGSKNFDQIKLYYGEVYEALTSSFTILACLNNLISDRKFDTFKSMTLNKYIHDLEKSKKDGPFKDSVIFNKFTHNLDSSLRNGSHHASIWRDNEVVMFRSGGTGSQRSISYSRYIFMCNSLTISLAAIFMIELYLIRKYS